jgi:hypothetical protein
MLKGCVDYDVMDWKIAIGDLNKERRGVKLSLEEKSNSSMTTKDARVFKQKMLEG